MKVVYLLNSCKKCGPVQQTLYIISHLDKKNFTPVLITLRREPDDGTSQLNVFLDLGIIHYYVPTSKSDILLRRMHNLKKCIDSLSPDIIHSLGVFPDYAVMRIGCSDRQLITIRNYMKDDYYSKFGIIAGKILERLQMSAVKRAKKVVVCSKSLAELYMERQRLDFGWICNGIDVSTYRSISGKEKTRIRKMLGLPTDKRIFVYSGSLIPRKNQRFLLELFKRKCLRGYVLLLLGDGDNLETIKREYGHLSNVDIRGQVKNVGEYLQASDIYISSSLSEGMPNGVLEAMAVGLPVILSNIRPHKEIFDANPRIGELFNLADEKDCLNKIIKLLESDLNAIGKEAECCAKNDFSAKIMSEKYQNLYRRLY